MRPIIVANVHELEGLPFLVARFFDDSGCNTLDEVVKHYLSKRTISDTLIDLLFTYDVPGAEVWTSTRDVYLECLSVVGLGVVLKRPQDTSDTASLLRSNADDFIELYGLRSLEAVARLPLPKWKATVIQVLEYIVTKLRGGDQK